MGSRSAGRANPPERSYYTLAEAAEMLGVHYETAARWVRSGKLPGVRLSRKKVVVPKDKCHALLSGGSTTTPGTSLPVGSPAWWLGLVGTLTPKEAERIMATVEECFERVEEDF